MQKPLLSSKSIVKIKKNIAASVLLIAMLVTTEHTHSQTPADALMMPAKNACVLASYDYGSFDHYWEGSRLRDNLTIATVKRQTVLPMVAVGITDKMNLYVSTPYVNTHSTDPNGGKFAGASGFQDIGLNLKYEVLKKATTNGELAVLGAAGFSTPMTNYLADYMPYSLGFGAPEVALRGIVQYKFKNSLYFRTSVAHLWRGYARAERDYYYNNGSYYTSWMDVPSAWTAEGIMGKWLFGNTLQIEASFAGLQSVSGDDIRSYNAPQPTNRVQWGRAGLTAHYFLPPAQKLGIVAYHTQVLIGRNAPQISNTGVGITFQFNYL